MAVVSGCRNCKKNTFYLLTLMYVIQNSTNAISMSRYYLLSRDRAIIQHNRQMILRKTRMTGPNNERCLSFLDIDKHFIQQDFRLLHRHSCPSVSDFNTTTIKVCPSKRVLDVDVNRQPVALYQVICRCLHCLTPWINYHTPSRCTPLFEFLQVWRIIGRNNFGESIYAQVWEPVSYACACTMRIHRRIRYVSPP